MSSLMAMFLPAKPDTEPANENHDNSDETIIVHRPLRMNPEYNFLCGICYSYLVQPLMCPFCKFKSCEKCFDVWFQQCTRIKKSNCCPKCDVEIDKDSLVRVPSLDELDRKLTVLEESNKRLENTLADLLVEFTGKVEKVTTENDVKLTQMQKLCLEEVQIHRTEVANAIEAMKTNLNVLKLENKNQTVKNSDNGKQSSSSVKENQKPTDSKKVELPSTARKVTSSKVPLNPKTLLTSAKTLPGNSYRAPVVGKQKLNENHVPKISDARDTQKFEGSSQAIPKVVNAARSFRN